MRLTKLQILSFFVIILCSINLFAIDNAIDADTQTINDSVKKTSNKIENINEFNQIKVPKLNTELDFANLKPEKSALNFNQIHFDFPNTQLLEFARFVTTLKQKILIGDELLTGNININTQKSPVTINELMDLLKAVLRTRGLEIIETEFYIQVMQKSNSITKVYKLKYLKASDLATSFSQMFRMSFRIGHTPENIQITAVDDENALMVLAPEIQHAEIRNSINELDIPVRQVLLEVMLLEITRTDDFGFGTSVLGKDKNYYIDMSNGALADKTVSYNLKAGKWTLGVNANESETKLKVLSQPSVLATNNEKASIKIAKKQPYVNGTSTTTIGGDVKANSTSSTTATAEVGIDIEITPIINFKKDVTLELKLTLSAIISEVTLIMGTDGYSPAPNKQPVPEIGHRIINSTAVIETGKILVIGGLIKNQKTTSKTALPILGEIPYIGSLLSTTTESVEQSEIMIFIAPIVIDHSDQIKAYSDNEVKKLLDYDTAETEKLKTMLKGKKVKTDDTFNFYDYFTDSNYRKKQNFIQEPINLGN